MPRSSTGRQDLRISAAGQCARRKRVGETSWHGQTRLLEQTCLYSSKSHVKYTASLKAVFGVAIPASCPGPRPYFLLDEDKRESGLWVPGNHSAE